MLKINKLKVDIYTKTGVFGRKIYFYSNLNIIVGLNSSGKSSLFSSILYSLGLEQLLGSDTGHKSLKPCFHTAINDNDEEFDVAYSKIMLEITNGSEIITLLRYAKSSEFSDSLVMVYESSLENITKCKSSDYYLHSSGSAQNERGFHTYFVKFINVEIPDVFTFSGKISKLYLQIIFSGIFIEQISGWNGMFENAPRNFGIKDVRKKGFEFLLGLDTFETEMTRDRLLSETKILKEKWESKIESMLLSLSKLNLSFKNAPKKLKINFGVPDLQIIDNVGNEFEIEKKIKRISDNISKIESEQLNYSDTIANDIIEEIESLKEDVLESELDQEIIYSKLIACKGERKLIETMINSLIKEFKNLKDLYKVQTLGSNMDIVLFRNTCPTCEQKINEYNDVKGNIMTLEQSKNFLSSQKKLLEFRLNKIDKELGGFETRSNAIKEYINTNRKRIKSLIGDFNYGDIKKLRTKLDRLVIYKIDLIKYISLKDELEKYFLDMSKYSERKTQLENDFGSLPKSYHTPSDLIKISDFSNSFVSYLRMFNYRSTGLNDVIIDKDNYIPKTKGYKVKVSASASDNIRSIWSYVISLLKIGGFKIPVTIFDEPKQHEVNINDIIKMLEVLGGMNMQSIVFSTLENRAAISELKKVIVDKKLNKKESLNFVTIQDNKVFKKYMQFCNNN